MSNYNTNNITGLISVNHLYQIESQNLLVKMEKDVTLSSDQSIITLSKEPEFLSDSYQIGVKILNRNKSLEQFEQILNGKKTDEQYWISRGYRSHFKIDQLTYKKIQEITDKIFKNNFNSEYNDNELKKLNDFDNYGYKSGTKGIPYEECKPYEEDFRYETQFKKAYERGLLFTKKEGEKEIDEKDQRKIKKINNIKISIQSSNIQNNSMVNLSIKKHIQNPPLQINETDLPNDLPTSKKRLRSDTSSDLLPKKISKDRNGDISTPPAKKFKITLIDNSGKQLPNTLSIQKENTLKKDPNLPVPCDCMECTKSVIRSR